MIFILKLYRTEHYAQMEFLCRQGFHWIINRIKWYPCAAIEFKLMKRSRFQSIPSSRIQMSMMECKESHIFRMQGNAKLQFNATECNSISSNRTQLSIMELNKAHKYFMGFYSTNHSTLFFGMKANEIICSAGWNAVTSSWIQLLQRLFNVTD